MIRRVFYVSRAAAGVTHQVVQVILAASRPNNWRLDITGLLMFSGTCFAQVVEGSSASVELLLSRIAKDPRHRDIQTLLDVESKVRAYGDWAMGHLHSASMADELERLATGAGATSDDALQFLSILRPDTVMGGL